MQEHTVIQRMSYGKKVTDVLDLPQKAFEELVKKYSNGGFHSEQKHVPLTLEKAQKLARAGEEVVGKGSIMTEDFEKSVVCLMSLMEQIWQVGQKRQSFRMELYFNAETLQTNYCFFAPTDKSESNGIYPEPLKDPD